MQYGIRIARMDNAIPGNVVAMKDSKVVWWGTLSELRKCPDRFDTLILHPDDYEALRKFVPQAPSQGGGR
jgi:hypothetical protein